MAYFAAVADMEFTTRLGGDWMVAPVAGPSGPTRAARFLKLRLPAGQREGVLAFL